MKRGRTALEMIGLAIVIGIGLPFVMTGGSWAQDATNKEKTEASGIPGGRTQKSVTPKTKVQNRPSSANAFNRLMKTPASSANAKPADDGIHDPANRGTHSLQWPSEAFQGLPKTRDGNRVDWVGALDKGLIQPWIDLGDPKAEAFIMDLVIVREVKGSMPDVVYPHKQHTQWLDCSNCHDGIFVPQKGANQISMAGILLGRQCGVCHGRVAFPVSDCRRCHSKPKSADQLKALARKSAWRAKGKGGTQVRDGKNPSRAN